jgi:hypothetical protein
VTATVRRGGAGASGVRKSARTIHWAVREVFRLAGIPTNGRILQVSNALEEARGQRQSAFRWALLVFEPAAKGVMIDTNSRGYDDLALVRLSQVSLQSRH